MPAAVWIGAGVGLLIAIILGVIFCVVFYVANNKIFSGDGELIFKGVSAGSRRLWCWQGMVVARESRFSAFLHEVRCPNQGRLRGVTPETGHSCCR